MTNQSMTTKMLALGFAEAARDPKNPSFYADLGTPVTGLWRGERTYQGQFQYVDLCSYLGDFVEAVVTVYQNRYNSRLKPQQTAVFAGLCRSESDLTSAVEKKYELPKAKA